MNGRGQEWIDFDERMRELAEEDMCRNCGARAGEACEPWCGFFEEEMWGFTPESRAADDIPF